MPENNINVTDGLLKDNTILSAGMIISPVIMCTTTFKNSVALIYAFSVITFFTDIIAFFIPKKLPYAIRVIISAVIGSLIYIPVKALTLEIYPQSVENIGIYFPLLAVNSLIVYQTQNRFYNMKFRNFLENLIFYILGFDVVAVISGILRELVSYGTINNTVVNIDTVIPSFALPCGGFIVLGVLCGIYRKIRSLLSVSSESRK